MKKVAIITSGGDGAGINAAIEMVSRDKEIDLYGFHYGLEGILKSNLVRLTNKYCKRHSLEGKQLVKTARSESIYSHEKRQSIKSILKDNEFSYLIICGGNGSKKAAKILFDEGIQTLFIPMTVDNDVKGSEYTIGFDTALNEVTNTVRALQDTAFNMPGRIFMVEVLGGDCGNLALHSAVSSGSDLAIIPEYSTNKKEIIKLVRKKLEDNDSIIIICSESAYDDKSYKIGQQGVSFEIGSYIEEKTGIRVRTTVMGFSLRSGAPTYKDTMMAAQMGFVARECINNNSKGEVIGAVNGAIKTINYSDNTKQSSQGDLEDDIIKLAINNKMIVGG